jgi:hypothetical protein
VICPSCQSAAGISLAPSGKSSLQARAIPRPSEGRFAIVTDVGRGMRWTRHVKRRMTVARVRRSRVVLTPRRWRQVGGMIRWRRWQESPVTGESAKQAVKTIAQGRPGVSGEPVVTTLVCFVLFRTRGCGCALGIRLSLRPLLFRGTMLMHHSGAFGAAGRRRCVRRHCEERSDEAIQTFRCGCQSGLLRGACHRARIRGTRWLAMTVLEQSWLFEN